MKLIVGLGNPGVRYADTRHNLGSVAVKALAKKLKVNFKSDRYGAWRKAKVNIGKEEAILLILQTYMNLSGEAISLFTKKYPIDLKELLVVVDDINMPLGVIRLKKGGSAGGHNGLKSIIGALGSQDFPRLRLGILADREIKKDLSDFVLEGFTKRELTQISQQIENAVMCIKEWINNGIDAAMNKYNKRQFATSG